MHDGEQIIGNAYFIFECQYVLRKQICALRKKQICNLLDCMTVSAEPMVLTHKAAFIHHSINQYGVTWVKDI